MKKILRFALLMALVQTSFVACTPKASLEGTWLEMADNQDENEVDANQWGFTLLDNGTVLSINMGYREYFAWEKNGDNLILKLNYLGYNSHEDVDTMKIAKLTKEELVLEDAGGNSLVLKRKVADVK